MSTSSSSPAAAKKAKLGASADINIDAELSSARKENSAQFVFNEKRVRRIRHNPGFLKQECKAVSYWMSRDQRVQDNWALIYAQKLATENRLPFHVVFCLVPKFLDATIRHYDFMLRGLEEVSTELSSLQIHFHLLEGLAADVLPKFIEEQQVGCLVTDMSPLRTPKKWVEDVAGATPQNMCFYQVDAHNVVPVWEASDKQEYAARTIRPKIHKKMDEYLTQFPAVVKHPHQAKSPAPKVDWSKVRKSLQVDEKVKPVKRFKPGTRAGLDNLSSFVSPSRLKLYSQKRNDPNVPEALSDISPWAHFGQISVQRALLYVKEKGGLKFKEAVAAFVEEALVRRELSDNFCYYQEKYDSLEGASDWARQTLLAHAKDQRQHVYSLRQLEEAQTHDELWNAAQAQMVREGKMHGFLRMYWAKKILEWTESPKKGLEIAIYLNDRYSLDGRDPNGYVGCMWSVCGVHDMGWKERSVFGKIRYMNYQGCRRKFDVDAFVAKYNLNKKKN